MNNKKRERDYLGARSAANADLLFCSRRSRPLDCPSDALSLFLGRRRERRVRLIRKGRGIIYTNNCLHLHSVDAATHT